MTIQSLKRLLEEAVARGVNPLSKVVIENPYQPGNPKDIYAAREDVNDKNQAVFLLLT